MKVKFTQFEVGQKYKGAELALGTRRNCNRGCTLITIYFIVGGTRRNKFSIRINP